MINSVYTEVINRANKAGYGLVSDVRFNSHANTAQMKIFSEILSDYRRSFNKYTNEKEQKAAQDALDRLYSRTPLYRDVIGSIVQDYFLLPSDFAI